MDIQPVFNKVVKYLEKALNDTRTQWTEKPVEHTATFKELSRVDPTQHKFAMAVNRSMRKFPRIPVMENGMQKKNEQGEEVFSIDIDDEIMYDLTARFVREMTVLSADFGEQQRAEFLNDAGAIYELGWWLMAEKIIPFFLALHTT